MTDLRVLLRLKRSSMVGDLVCLAEIVQKICVCEIFRTLGFKKNQIYRRLLKIHSLRSIAVFICCGDSSIGTFILFCYLICLKS